MEKFEILKNAKAEEFWNNHLKEIIGADSVAFFGGTNRRTENSSTTERIYLDLAEVNKISELCNDSNLLVYNFYLVALGILLSRYEDEYLLLSPLNILADEKENEELFFIKPEINFNENFKTLFSSHKEQLVKALENPLSWDLINDYFNEKVVLDRIAQFGLIINEIGSNKIQDIVQTLFKLKLKSNRPYFEIIFKGEMYDPKLLVLFSQNFKTLIAQILEKIYTPTEELNYKGVLETKIINDINKSKVSFSLDKNIIDLINLACVKHKDRVAIRHNAEEITYDQLYKYTNKLSRYILDAYDVRKDDLLGIMLPRSINMTKGILSVWKSAGAYVPIGTDLSDENLLQIIEDSKLKAIITDNINVIKQLTKLKVQTPIINLNEIGEKVDMFSAEPTINKIKSNDLAYVIYTSGSTGKPKGVMIEHLGMLNHIGSKIDELSIRENSIVAQNAPHTFDISIWQLFSPLVAGGESIIYDNDIIVDVEKFVSVASKDKVTVLELVPSYLLEMLDFIERDTNIINLELGNIVLNAETLSNSMVKRWLSLYPEIAIVNTYGATEVSDDISHYFMNEVPSNYSVPVMLNPIQNFEVHIVDEKQKQVPVGVKGEILLAGPCVGRGYFNDEEKTKAAFLKGPLNEITLEERIYKTGDLGKFTSEGVMEFMGRNDDQVKILGHRIELGAIENIISSVNEVKNCKAVAFTDKQFIALYYLSNKSIEKKIIEKELLKKLPKYMLPSVYIHMDFFPLTSNGKIDHKSLPDPIDFMNLKGKEHIEPRTEIEKELAFVWKNILDVDTIGVKDSFFELGGHSLKLMRLKNNYKKVFEINLNLKELFENTTLESHAELINNSQKESFKQIDSISEQESYEISDGQKRLWVISQFEEASTAYNIPYHAELDIEDIDSFKRAIYAVVDRHEILRTVFKNNQNNELRQWVLTLAELDFKVDYLDYSKNDAPRVAAERYINTDSYIAFDLFHGPLLRTSILKLEENQYILYFNMHHIISDGGSMQILERDVFELYNAFKNDTKSELPKLKIQYKDYAAWSLNQINIKNQEKSNAFWHNKLIGELPIIDLPTNKVRPKLKTYNGNSFGMYLSKDTCDLLKTFIDNNGGSLFMALTAVFKVLLYRYTHQEDLIIGTVIDGRDHIDLKNQIGYYINSLALRSKMNSNEKFVSFYNRLKEDTINAYEYKEYPFNRLVEKLNIKRDTSRNAIFDVTLVFQNMGENSDTDWVTKEDTIIDEGVQPAKYDLSLTFEEFGNQIYFNVLHNTDVYQSDMIQGLMLHFKQLLPEILTKDEISYYEIPFLNVEEKKTLLHDFNLENERSAKLNIEGTVLDLFAEQVQKTPDDIAIKHGAKSVTFKELDILSNQLARCIVTEHNIESGDFVGILLDRNEMYVLSILGILKAGAVYVPIDPNYPNHRKEFMASDAVIRLMISDTSYMFEVDFFEGDLLAIDVEFDPKEYSQNQLNKITPKSNAYVIYTSGSTGRPKGVLVSHKNLYSSIAARNQYYDFVPSFLLVPSFSFDSSIAVLWEALTRGSELHLVSDKDLKDPSIITSIICNQKIASILCVPSYYNFIIKYLKDQKFNFKRIVLAGEALEKELVEKHYQISSALLYNEYGPTENTVWATVAPIPEDIDKITIGTPIANTKVLLLDAYNNLVPHGVTGEICLFGEGIAQGYINQEKITNERFIDNIYEPGGKMYKTGDYGRWLPDGRIEFIGRQDDQIKIRGYRIETGEIESVLKQKESIDAAIVIAQKFDRDNKELTAYIISNQEENTSNLRTFLSDKLPDYMVPHHYIQLESFPLNANGKIDKKALPNPKGIEMEPATRYVAPENEIEKTLIEIIALHLNKDKEKVGVEDNFFDLGADSLKIVNILSDINKALDINLKVLALFENSNVKELMKLFDQDSDEEEELENEQDLEQFDDILDLM